MDRLVQMLITGKIVAQFGVTGAAYDSQEDRVRYANNCIKACLDAAVIMKVALIDKEPSHSLMRNGDKLHAMFEKMFEQKPTDPFSKN